MRLHIVSYRMTYLTLCRDARSFQGALLPSIIGVNHSMFTICTVEVVETQKSAVTVEHVEFDDGIEMLRRGRFWSYLQRSTGTPRRWRPDCSWQKPCSSLVISLAALGTARSSGRPTVLCQNLYETSPFQELNKLSGSPLLGVRRSCCCITYCLFTHSYSSSHCLAHRWGNTLAGLHTGDTS